MSELTKSLVLAGAFVAFIPAAYIQEGGSWRGPHSLRKSLHPKSATVGMQEDRYGCDQCYVSGGKVVEGLSAGHVTVQRVRLARDLANDRNDLLHNITASAPGSTLQ
jgi:hypothetical protein